MNERLSSWRLPDGKGVTFRRLLGHTAGLGVPFFPGYAPGEALPTLVRVLDGAPPARFLSESGWFSHLGGAFGFFAGLFGSLEGGSGIAAMTIREATPAFFERLLEISAEPAWDGFSA